MMIARQIAQRIARGDQQAAGEPSVAGEVFRRSCLTLLPEWCLASGVTLVLFSAASHLRQPTGVGVLVLTVLPVAWAAARTAVWACQTWTATSDGRLIVGTGILPRTRQVVYLGSAQEIEPRSLPIARWLGIGHLSFRATDLDGQLVTLRWTWIGRHARLREIVQARGQWPEGRPARWRSAIRVVVRLARAAGRWWARGQALVDEMVARLRGRWFVADYGRFMAFCHHLLRSGGERGRCPHWVPTAVARTWMMVLRQCQIVVASPEMGRWHIAGTVRSLEDIRRRIDQDGLRLSVQSSTLWQRVCTVHAHN